ncbi:hypothetical protein HYH03_001677 [Edaphochlamys debaryana]|uniref:MYND-type domain-containing protein n=1 Tax=Edaphochlamys debaryana TaxID=47281 RepID=A0A835YFQ5_9CHLO|nr:hypothetical protein HYH03_001677 [Edaphochlamys debaryana]|eukprot:KAG2500091.1 hypothetical protein HYH03_001677 [Edaphochlamys debaryana]
MDPRGVRVGFSNGLAPEAAVLQIPESERTPFERDMAKAVSVIEDAAKLPVSDSLEVSSQYARRILYAEWLTSGLASPNDAAMRLRAIRAALLVERYTGMHVLQLPPMPGLPEMPAFMPSGSTVTIADVDPAAHDRMTADEFAVHLFVLRWVRLMDNWQTGVKLAQALYGNPRRRKRIQKVLLPALAKMDVGEPHHMTAPQWETAWLEGLELHLGASKQTSADTPFMQVTNTWFELTARLPELDPRRPMSYRWPVLVASTMDLYDEYIMWVHRVSLTLGELRGMADKAAAATRRLKRLHLRGTLMRSVGRHAAGVREALQAMDQLPDSTQLRLPYKVLTDEEMEEARDRALAAAEGGGCDGCGFVFAKYSLCGGCRQRHYCGKACQAADWRSGHKEACKQLAAKKGEAKAEAG